MFTGIVEEIGEITEATAGDGSSRLRVHGPLAASDARPGDSIAVNGVCLTVVDPGDDGFAVDVIRETLGRSSLAAATVGSRVNLERALPAGGRLGGHIVQGHVDGTATVESVESDPGQTTIRFALTDPGLTRYVIDKGSIAVDGVSLTVITADDAGFSVGLIPTTLRDTVLGVRGVGDTVNLEVDVVAKYVERLTEAYRHGKAGK